MSAPGEPTTIRALMERIRLRHRRNERYRTTDGTIVGPCMCGSSWPCPDHADAVAALAILDNAPRGSYSYRLLSDPDPVRVVGRVEPHDDAQEMQEKYPFLRPPDWTCRACGREGDEHRAGGLSEECVYVPGLVEPHDDNGDTT